MRFQTYIIFWLAIKLVESWKTFKIGLSLENISVSTTLSIQGVAGPMTIAIEDCKKDRLMENYNLTFVYREEIIHGRLGSIPVFKLINDDNVDLITGLFRSSNSKTSSIYASYKNVMMYAMASADPNLQDKVIYNNLVRPGWPTYSSMGKTIMKMLDYFKWDRLAVLKDNGIFCTFGANSIETLSKERNVLLVENILLDLSVSENDLKNLMIDLSKKVRVIAMCFNEIIMQKVMTMANNLKMTAEEYVFIYFTTTVDSTTIEPWGSGVTERDIKDSFSSLLQITVSSMDGEAIYEFASRIPSAAAGPPFFDDTFSKNNWNGSISSIFVYDTMYVICNILHESIKKNIDIRNVPEIMSLSKNRNFRSRLGDIKLDKNADRLPDYWLWHYDKNKQKFTHWLEIILNEDNYINETNIIVLENPYWETVNKKPPPSTPYCGFNNENCLPVVKSKTAIYASLAVLFFIFILTALVIFYIIRKRKMEMELLQMFWKVDMVQVEIHNKGIQSNILSMSLKSLKSNETNESQKHRQSKMIDGNIYHLIATYKGMTVFLKPIQITDRSFNINRHRLIEFKKLKDITHENLNMFVGLGIDLKNITIIWQYCHKGSLQDILENDVISLNILFKRSLISDLVSGMKFLHSTSLEYHGNLKSCNCLIDNRWVLKVTDFGLYDLRRINYENSLKSNTVDDYNIYKNLFWTAPEILRETNDKTYTFGNQPGDVYSFAIIVSEILYRGLTFHFSRLTPKEIIDKIKLVQKVPFRPNPPDDFAIDNDEKKYLDLMNDCWNDNPLLRPRFSDVDGMLKKLFPERSNNIMDVIINKLETYANNLESIVASRTQELIEEKKKTDTLLYRMLPETIANKLKAGIEILPEIFESATIYFSDVVGFTVISAGSTPVQVVDFLNDLYSLFDDILEQYDVYKVETIGDAYMVVSGIPKRNEMNHAIHISNTALHLLESIKKFKIRHKPDETLRLRIGIHTGPCAAGIVGITMPRYCLFGDTVNTASRMESNGIPSKIHLSVNTKDVLDSIAPNYYQIECRGIISVKGKGDITTYWLLGKTNQE